MERNVMEEVERGKSRNKSNVWKRKEVKFEDFRSDQVTLQHHRKWEFIQKAAGHFD